MSRLSKKPIVVPAGVTVSKEGTVLTVKGPKGELTRDFDKTVISVEIVDEGIQVAIAEDTKFAKALVGTYASHVVNMIEGVTNGYSKKLIVEGVGFRSEVKGSDLHMSLGFSHPVVMPLPEGITATAEKNVITITGINKEATHQFASQIRAKKKPEPYKGKGIRYEGEIIRRKQGKKSA